MKKPWSPSLRKFFAILVAMAALLFSQNEALAAPPAYRASGTFTSGTAAITVPYPASMLANDVCLLAVESENQAIALTTANGFVEVPTWSPQFAGTALTNPASRLAVFWKRTVGGDAAPVVTDAGDHTTGRIHCFSGVITSGNPWDTGAGGNDGAVNDTTGTIPGATTTLTDTLVVLITSNSRNGTSTANCSAWTNASMVLTEWSDNTNTAGLGGGHCMATGVMATAGTYATTTVTLATTSFKGAISLALKPMPITTLATGADPAAATIAPGDPATDVDLFTLQTSSGTEAITSVTVNLSTNSGVGRLAITDNLGTELGFTATPVAGANTITVAGMSATAALTTFKVLVTPLSHALMPAVPGAAYAITAPVTAWAGPNTHAGSDTNPNALTIDNLSPAGATTTSGTAGSESVTLGWTTSVDADFNTTSGSVLYRWTTTAGGEVPAEGSAPTINSTNGAATVACVLSSNANTVLSGIIDGTGGSAGCNTTALTAGTAYVYKIFQKDVNGNYDTGVTIGTFTTDNPIPTTTSISPTSQTLGALGFTLTVNGTNFVTGSVVRFNGVDRTTTYVSATQLTATIPASDLIVVGAFPITVFNPTPGGGPSNAQTFTVTPAPPTATTNAATGVTAWAATLNGTVSSNGASTAVSFDYGLTTAYGSSIAATPSPLGAGAVNTAVSAALTGLNCNTTFHYRVVATNSAGTTNGLDGTFITGACGAPYPATACAATRFGNDLGCTANDVNITGITLVAGSTSPSCVSGTPVTLDLDLTVNFASPDRWDVGIFIANDGNLPTLLPANGGASSCSVGILPTTPPFLDLDGVPQGTLDTCGDGNGSIDDSALPGGTVPLGDGVKRMTGVTLPCYASATSGGQLFVPFAVSWDNQKSPTGSLCTSNLYPVPNTTSKCNAPASSVSIAVVVLPVITKTNGGTEINPGANTTYTVVINNNSGGTLQASFFKDPAVANLTVNSLTCAAAGGATCPIANNTVADMQGATGIPIPSANLPNNSSLTFTINATLSGAAIPGNHLVNTASVSIGSNSNSATDDDLIVNAPSAAKSFAPSTITEGAASVLTITLTNPTATDVTGVSFTDTYPAGLVNTAAAGGATTCGGIGVTVTAANDGNSLALSGGTIPANSSCTVTVNVTSATAGSYPNSTGTVTHATGTISAASAILTVNAAVYGGFNACDSAAAPNAACTNTTTPTTSHITTRIAGSPFNLDIVALKTDGTRQTTYNNNVVVDLLDASDNSGALDAYNCRSTWTAIIATLTSTGFGANGLLTVGPFNVPEAYRDVRVRVTNSGGTTKKGCSTDNFAIRPNSLVISATDADWQTAGTARALANTNVSGGNVHKAGQPFTVTATAKNFSNVTTLNYAGTPALAVSDCTPAGTACTASLGAFDLGTTTSFVSGVLTSNLATYSEVGAFNLTLQDTGFASADAADTAATCAGYYVCSAATAVGRFVPDHFDTAVVATATVPMPCPTGLTCPVLYPGFAYSGQLFSLTATAKNASGNTIVNYNTTTGLAKTTNLTAWGELGTTTVPTGAGALGVASVTAFAAGTLTEAAESYTFTTVPTAPTDIYMRAEDTDGVTSLRTTNPTTTSVEGGVKVVSGRIKIGNAHGSELLPLPMTATVQYYNGTYWTTSITDDVTSFDTTLSTSGGNLVATIISGLGGGITVSNPGTNTVVDGVRTFRFAAPGVRGSANISLNAPAYLPSNTARATFGVYKGNNEFIYIRENY